MAGVAGEEEATATVRQQLQQRTQTEDEEKVTSSELLPGISNNIALHKISTLLRWTTLENLTSVSRPWSEAAESREMYNARVRSHSTEALAVIKCDYGYSPGNPNGIVLYSVKAKAICQLPRFTTVGSEFPQACGCVTMDGKIYLVGGLLYVRSTSSFVSSNEVYVLDQAGLRPWKRCASMLVARHQFGCGVINGKIYSFGGMTLHLGRYTPVDTAEVYDPEVDAWTAIKSMTSWRFGHQVGTLGDHLLVYGGNSRKPNRRATADNIPSGWSDISRANYLEIYNPVQDTWRIVLGPWQETAHQTFFISEGKLHSMTPSAIFVYDLENRSRIRLQSSSYSMEGLFDTPKVGPVAIVPLDGELLAVFEYSVLQTESFGIRHLDSGPSSPRPRRFQISGVLGLLRSKGFGVEDTEIVWEKAEGCLAFDRLVTPFIVPLRL